jgi:hypothetical protein
VSGSFAFKRRLADAVLLGDALNGFTETLAPNGGEGVPPPDTMRRQASNAVACMASLLTMMAAL